MVQSFEISPASILEGNDVATRPVHEIEYWWPGVVVQTLSFLLLAWFISSPAWAQAGIPAAKRTHDDASSLAEASMLLRKGFLFVQVDVLNVTVRFGRKPSQALRALAESGRPPRVVSDMVAKRAIDSLDVSIDIAFCRDIGLDRFISEARKATERVWKAGVIAENDYRRVYHSLPFWYRSLKGRGIRSGDRMFYRIQGDRLHTRYVGTEGTVFVDQVDQGASARLTVLGSYFVKGSDFREPLIESLLNETGQLLGK